MMYGLAFLLILVPLVVFHELGHFLMAKLGGIRVTKFAFGFGKKLFGFHYKGTEYRWNLLPLGGYVDFMGELVYTHKIPDDVTHFYNKPKWLRFLVLVMGPLFNLILAFGILWAYHGVVPVYTPIYHGEPYTVGFVVPESAEAEAGLLVNDRILTINERPARSISQVEEYVLLNPRKEMRLGVKRDGEETTVVYKIPEHPEEGLGTIGFAPALRLMIARVIPGTPAQRAGFQAGDIILEVNGHPVSPYLDKVQSINAYLTAAAPEPSVFTLERNRQVLNVAVTPEKDDAGQWLAGFQYGGESTRSELSWNQAFFKSWQELKRGSTLIYQGIKKLIIGDLSLKTLSGPIGVGKIAKESLEYGFWSFMFLMAILSLNLGIMNLLPIPVLDGGEIFVLLVEWISRKDFNLATKMRIKIVGFIFLIGLMGMVIITDVLKIYNAM